MPDRRRGSASARWRRPLPGIGSCWSSCPFKNVGGTDQDFFSDLPMLARQPERAAPKFAGCELVLEARYLRQQATGESAWRCVAMFEDAAPHMRA
jgi:hypothetical protein